MKKISNLIVLLLVSFITAGCNQYISSEVTDVNNVSKTYYGAYNNMFNANMMYNNPFMQNMNFGLYA